jgi:hypothetical protein
MKEFYHWNNLFILFFYINIQLYLNKCSSMMIIYNNYSIKFIFLNFEFFKLNISLILNLSYRKNEKVLLKSK